MPRRRVVVIIVLLFALLAIGGAWMQFGRDANTGPLYTGLVEGVAVGGYDAVSYFNGTPREGSSDITTHYRGAQWRFASQANKAAFEANPQRYAPAYGGYCAWAMARGTLAKGDPRYWDIVDGRLYLNYDAGVQKKWRADKPGLIDEADVQWQARGADGG